MRPISRRRCARVTGPDGAAVLDPVSGAPVAVGKIDPVTGGPARERVQVGVKPTGLLTSDGIYWAISSLVDNFKNFPPLAIVLVGMLGIGLAERTVSRCGIIYCGFIRRVGAIAVNFWCSGHGRPLPLLRPGQDAREIVGDAARAGGARRPTEGPSSPTNGNQKLKEPEIKGVN